MLPLPKATFNRLRQHYALLAITAVYVLLSCLYLNRPGLEYDEVLFGNAALGGVDGSFIAYQWNFGVVRVPVMLMNYIGAVKSTLYAPLFAVFPISAVTVRLPMVVAGLATLVLAYQLVTLAFNRRAALIMTGLLATDPSYIFSIRLDWGPVALMLLLKLGSLFCFARFIQTRRPAYLALGALAAGVGLYDKANFVWYLAALPLAAVVAWRGQVLPWATWRNALTAAAFFLLGCWPLLIYNVVTGGATLDGQLKLPANWLAVAQSKGQLLLNTLNGSAIYQYTNGSQPARLFAADTANSAGLVGIAQRAIDLQGTWLPWGLAAACVLMAMLLVTNAVASRRIYIFFIGVFGLLLFLIYVTYNANGPHHIMMLYPLPQLIIASALAPTWRSGFEFKPSLLWLKLAAVRARPWLLVALVASNLMLDLKYLVAYAHDGGVGIWSDAIYTLADYANAHKDQTYALMDWGFNTQLLLLSRGTVARREIFWSLMDSASANQEMSAVYGLAQQPRVLFVFHTPRYTVFPHVRQVFDSALQKYGLTTETVNVITQRNGDPIYIVERVVWPNQP